MDIHNFNVLKLIKCNPYFVLKAEAKTRSFDYIIIQATPATGILYITNNSRDYISGHVRLRGRNNGKYPHQYLLMLARIFGYIPGKNTIEVCSNNSKFHDAVTVDINPAHNPDIVDDGQLLSKVASNSFNRWRCDPPYNFTTAKKMYNTELPSPSKLLTAGARVCKSGSLMFLLLGGGTKLQWHPEGIKQIGWIAITIVPNQEVRNLHIYYKE